MNSAPINPRTGEEFRGLVIHADGSRTYCDEWSYRSEMYSLALLDVFEDELGKQRSPWAQDAL